MSKTTNKFAPEVRERAVRTTVSDKAAPCPPAEAEEQFYAAADQIGMAA